MDMVGRSGAKAALQTRLNAHRRNPHAGHGALQFDFGEPKIAIRNESSVDGIDSFGGVGHEIEYPNEHAVVEFELFL